MNWVLDTDSEYRRVYTRETKRGQFRLVLVRGAAGFAWRVLRCEGERKHRLASKLVRLPNTGWDTIEGLSFLAAENSVTPELEQLAAVAEA